MRVLLDHCVDWRLGRSLLGHTVRTTRDMGWERLRNGILLTAAAAQFDLLLTVDRNIKYQQNLNTLPVAVVVMIAPTNRLADLLPLLPGVEQVIQRLAPRTLTEVRLP